MMADLKTAFRQLRKSPAFTATAVLTLALGIGATTAIFTLVDQVLLKSLPVKDPTGLWRIGNDEQCCFNGGLPTYTGKPYDWALFSYPQYIEFRDHTAGLKSLAAFEGGDREMAVRRAGSHDPAQPYYGEFVSGNSFDVLGLRAYAGRLLEPQDDVTGAPPVAVMSFQTWEEMGREPAVVGSSWQINGQAVTVVGVAPPGFYSERLSDTPPSFWMPIHMSPMIWPRDADLLQRGEQQWLNLMGRLAPGASVLAVQARMVVELQAYLRSPVAKLQTVEVPLIPRQYLRLSPGGGGVQRMQQQYRGDLHLLMWVSSFVLLIACANLANLMLTRSVAQRQQTAVRAALGAQRKQLVRRALTECLVLALTGGLAGIVVAWGGAKLILHLAFAQNPITISASPSLAVLGFAIVASVVTGLLFGVAPAWRAAQADPIEALRGANRATGRHETFAQKALVVAQAAVSVVLLCAAGLLILSLRKLEHQHFGFEAANRTIVKLNTETAGLPPERLDDFYRKVNDSLSTIPGVERVAWSTWSPMDGNNYGESVWVDGQPAPPPGSPENGASWVRVSPSYFATIGTQVIAGRSFTESDNRTAASVAVVDEAFVRHFLHGENPIGVHFGDLDAAHPAVYTIVGVVEDAQYWPPNDPQELAEPMYFLPSGQWEAPAPVTPVAAGYAQFLTNTHYMDSLEIETHGRVPELEAQVRNRLTEINPNLMIVHAHSFAEQVQEAFSQQAMIVQLTSLFGLVALALAAIGLYGVTAYAVAQRTSEIGIRMALGANRMDVQRMVLRGAFLQVGVGLAIGIPCAIEAGHLMAAELFGVGVANPLVLGTTVVVLGLSALLAASLPARRAASVEPMEALRGE
ncbi:MAG TPA: ABC transporter permease [Acidobacteriaceae bacterium]|jgi:predicted permease|nr:ABC transporter permease [Acidobacteriaceae bacterium]